MEKSIISLRLEHLFKLRRRMFGEKEKCWEFSATNEFSIVVFDFHQSSFRSCYAIGRDGVIQSHEKWDWNDCGDDSPCADTQGKKPTISWISINFSEKVYA